VGRVVLRPKYNTCSFEVGSEKELRVLIDLLDKYPLLGDKYLDYLNFRKAFFLYFDRSGLVTESLKTEIEELRANHNTKRVSTTLPDNYKRVITDYKLLGLIEGEGSFFLQKKGLTPRFELELTSAQKPGAALRTQHPKKLSLHNKYIKILVRTDRRGAFNGNL